MCASRVTDTLEQQSQVREWFDATYETRGLGYLRPPEAYPIFLQLLEARPGERLLDVACGPGLLLRAARARSLHATGVDLSRVAVAMVPRVAPGASALQANAEGLPFGDGTFDAVTCIGSLERFLDRPAALREMRRVAARGARFCLMVRNARTFGWKVATQGLGRVNHRGHQDAGTLEEWRALLEECGFVVRRVVADQWFWQKWRNRLFMPRDGQPEPLVTRVMPLRFANELIFILEARG
jgi:SAM-dependent methyltransferase